MAMIGLHFLFLGILFSVLYCALTKHVNPKTTADCLVFSTSASIGKTCLGTPRTEYTLLPTRQGQGRNIVPVDVDVKQQCVYYADVSSVKSSIEVKCSGDAVRVIRSSNFSLVDSVALDWVTGNLYWIEKATRRLGVTSNDGRFTKVLYEGTDLFGSPRGLALHPELGQLFWTDWSAVKPRIVRASMNGDPSSVHVLLQRKDNLGWVNGIALDIPANEIYWVDARRDIIGIMDMAGRYRKTIPLNESHPFAIALSSEYIYWSDWESKRINRMRKDSWGNVTLVKKSTTRPMGLALWAEKAEVKTASSLVATSCPYLWLLGHNTTTQSAFGQCYCPDGFTAAYTNDQLECTRVNASVNNVTSTASTPVKVYNTTSKCTAVQFDCGEGGKCIPPAWRCDGDEDCVSGRDEEGCRIATCGPQQFQCRTSKCIPRAWACDGQKDCAEGEDEQDCSTPKNCSSTEFMCDNKCISARWRCDGDSDCVDKADELNCSTTALKNCSSGEFMCDNKCMPVRWRCDGDSDCVDKADELNCSTVPAARCSEAEFDCGNNNCVHINWVCDGERDCMNGADEKNCSNTNSAKTTSSSSVTTSKTATTTVTTTAPQPAERPTDCLVYVTGDEVQKICQDNNTRSVVVKTNASWTLDVDVEHTHRCIFYTAYVTVPESTAIKKSCYPSWKTPSTLVNITGGNVEGVAYDWAGENIYWLDVEKRVLMVTDKTGRFTATLYQGDIFGNPRDLVLRPEKGDLFWSDWSSENPAIMQASMAGDEASVRALVKDDLGWPNGLALDTKVNQLYWADAKLDKIKVLDLNAYWSKTVRELESFSHPYGLAVSDKFIYWTDWRESSVVAVRKDSPMTSPVITVVGQVQSPKGLAIVPRKTKDLRPCTKVCPQLCLGSYNGSTGRPDHICRCADGFLLEKDSCGHPACVEPPKPVDSHTEVGTRPTTGSTTTPISSDLSFPFTFREIQDKNYTVLPSTCRPVRLHRLCPLQCHIKVEFQDSKPCLMCICQ